MNLTASRKLRYGPYASPRVRYGSKVTDVDRGDVIVCGLSDAPTAWTLGRLAGRSSRGLILYRDLARAVKREAASAVAHHWGVTPQTVTRWRKALGVEGPTDGERALRAEHGRRNWRTVGPKLLAKSADSMRAGKISKALTGRARAPATVEKMREAATGRKASMATRAAMSAAHRKRGTRPPWLNAAWTAAEDKLLGKLLPAEVAERTGRTTTAVYQRRAALRRGQLG